MENNEIVIIGGGQLGGALQKFLPQARLLDYPEVDITDYESLAAAFAKIENACVGNPAITPFREHQFSNSL